MIYIRIYIYIYDPGSAVPPPPPPMVPPHPPLWCGVVVGCFPPPPVVWCGVVVGCFPPPCGVVWFGCGLWWFPPFTPCGVVWVGWFPLHSPCMFGSAWGVWQTHASRPWGHDLCDSCRFGAIGIGLQWVNCHRDRACQGTWST